jgi:hypothetical protein
MVRFAEPPKWYLSVSGPAQFCKSPQGKLVMANQPLRCIASFGYNRPAVNDKQQAHLPCEINYEMVASR